MPMGVRAFSVERVSCRAAGRDRAGPNQSRRPAAVSAVVSMATGSTGLRATAASVLDGQHDDQDNETDENVDHRARPFRQDAPRSSRMTGMGPP